MAGTRYCYAFTQALGSCLYTKLKEVVYIYVCMEATRIVENGSHEALQQTVISMQ